MNSPAGRIEIEGDLATLIFERELPYPPQAVWDAITDPAQRALWFGHMEVEPQAGGRIYLVAEGPPVPPEVRTISGKILVWDPPKVFEHEWLQGVIGQTSVRYELEPTESGTRLKFTHRQLAAKAAQGFVAGTHAYLDALEAAVGGLPVQDWRERVAEVKGLYMGAW